MGTTYHAILEETNGGERYWSVASFHFGKDYGLKRAIDAIKKAGSWPNADSYDATLREIVARFDALGSA